MARFVEGELVAVVVGYPISVAVAVNCGDVGGGENVIVEANVVENTLVLVVGVLVEGNTETKWRVAFQGATTVT